MKQRVLVALLTVLVFASGFAARAWTEGMRALPPPSMGSEFAPPASGNAAHPPADTKKPVDRVQIIADVEKLGPQIATFRAKMDEIDAGFDRDFIVVLNTEQNQHRIESQAESQKKKAERAKKELPSSHLAPLTDDEIVRLQQRPLYGVLFTVAVTAKLEQVTKDYKLSPEQQATVRDLLLVRRDKFLALVDSVPLPSIMFSRLAPVVQKLAAPKKGLEGE